MSLANSVTTQWLIALCCGLCVVGGATAFEDAQEQRKAAPQEVREEAIGPIAAPIGCKDVFIDAPALAPPSWGGAAPSGKARGDMRLLYDDCSPADFTVDQCALPVGQQFCYNGHWTVLCRENSHCPEDMLCTWGAGTGTLPADESFGWCAKICTGDRVSGCTRRDLACDRNLRVCLAKNGDAPEEDEPCTEGNTGLGIHIVFDKAECGVYDDTVFINIAGTAISKTDRSESVVRDYNIAWPHGVQRGAAGNIEYYARGEGVTATGTARFVVDPGSCVRVDVQARCVDPSLTEDPGN